MIRKQSKSIISKKLIDKLENQDHLSSLCES